MKNAFGIVIAVGMLFATSANAAKHGGPMGAQDCAPAAKQMSGMMRDMGGMMSNMRGPMSQGNMTPQQQRQMAERMRMMSHMMETMSGEMGRGMMMDGDMPGRMEQMRKQMDEIMRTPVPKK